MHWSGGAEKCEILPNAARSHGSIHLESWVWDEAENDNRTVASLLCFIGPSNLFFPALPRWTLRFDLHGSGAQKAHFHEGADERWRSSHSGGWWRHCHSKFQVTFSTSVRKFEYLGQQVSVLEESLVPFTSYTMASLIWILSTSCFITYIHTYIYITRALLIHHSFYNNSLKYLHRERAKLSRLMGRRLSREERESLFTKWEIDLGSKGRKLQLVNLLWSKTDDMIHIKESAAVISKVARFPEQASPLKGMLGFSFAASSRRRSLGWINSKSSLPPIPYINPR